MQNLKKKEQEKFSKSFFKLKDELSELLKERAGDPEAFAFSVLLKLIAIKIISGTDNLDKYYPLPRIFSLLLASDALYSLDNQEINESFYLDYFIPACSQLAVLIDQEKSGSCFFDLSEEEKNLNIPNSFFINAVKNLFTGYSFKADEHSGDSFISPQILGSIFETETRKGKYKSAKIEYGRGKNPADFYTPKSISCFMIKNAIFEYLISQNPEITRSLIFNLIFKCDSSGLLPEERKALLDNIKSLKLLDPSCGTGVFLIEAGEILFKITKQLHPLSDSDDFQIASDIFNIITGYDILEEACNISRLRIWFYIVSKLKINKNNNCIHTFPILNNPVKCSDALKIALQENIKFDIIVGNPPYGIKLPIELKNKYKLKNSDSYGIFTAACIDLLLPGGVLSFIMPDTWQTIKTHKPLRDIILDRTLKSIIAMPADTFKASVNSGICTLINNKSRRGKNWIISANFSAEKTESLCNKLESVLAIELTEKIPFPDKFINACIISSDPCGYTIESDKTHAVYAYKDDLPHLISSSPIFAGSPKLFMLIANGLEADAYTAELNGKQIDLVRLGAICDIAVGLQTGENHRYIRTLSDDGTSPSRNYPPVDSNLILLPHELEKIAGSKKLRAEITSLGISKSPGGARYFSGRYFVPYDKGGTSQIDQCRLPGYYVPQKYFIDWSEEAISLMKTLTQADKKRKPGYEKHAKLCSRFQNSNYYFLPGITVSYTGIYAPIFRIKDISVFDVGGSSIFPKNGYEKWIPALIGILSSKLIKYIAKTMLNSTVNYQIEELKSLPIPINSPALPKIQELSLSIIKKQKENPCYNYLLNEQREIDEIIYEIFGLDEDDIAEVEAWYFRRYPNLANSIDKATDYLHN